MQLPLVFTAFIISTSAEIICDTFNVCPNFGLTKIEEDAAQQPVITGWQNESVIGKQGHWDGIKPVNYNLKLNFFNMTHYNGTVAIEFNVINSTKRIMINHHVRYPQVDYSKISITNCVIRKVTRPPSRRTARSGCIEKATFWEHERTLILELKTVTLEAGENYVIKFDKFEGRSEGDYGSLGAIGLKEGTVEDSPSLSGFSAITTIFQMRYARTVFPCFDHPSLKATFEFCIEYPTGIKAASNMEIQSSDIGSDTRKDCFYPTPVIPTYVFTFSLMKNYSSESTAVPNGPTIELLAPQSKIAELRWMLPEAVPVVQYLERITKFKFPLKKLAFVAQWPAPFWGVENFGLVTVDGSFMANRGSTAYTILYHEIVHQWLGNVATISHWSEICLQEGLTAYIEWKISADRRNGSLLGKVHEERSKNDGSQYYPAYALLDFEYTQNIADHCFGRPPLFFHTMAKMCGGFEAIEKFLAKLVERARYGTADIDLYDQIMGEVCQVQQDASVRQGPLGSGLVKGWFLKPGPLYLTAWRDPSNTNRLIIEQNVIGKDDDHPNATVSPRPVPVVIEFFGITGAKQQPVILQVNTTTVLNDDELGPDIGYLIDPNREIFIRKAYTSANYRRILQLRQQHPNVIKDDQFKFFVHDFCTVFLDNVLPLENEPTSTTSTQWLEVMNMMKSSAVPLGGACKCCLGTKQEGSSDRMCNWRWEQWCKDLRLVKLLGRG